ncbi:MAG: hypothetical protein HN855_10325 [Anaerolineae bacterium]|jgi:hypothetical protein|nr:hypothetical protein [Anaerolineae bacterium]MBT7069516.1 hypothetical protein [Anaerolineae bacterium]MBT7325547.1 hypothetical protein [Anaerolineae bacterium]
MDSKIPRAALRVDALGLILAGLINTFLASADAGLILAPGTATSQPDILLRINWIAENTLRWQAGWLFWFAVTLSFSWSYYALGRHLNKTLPWVNLAIGLALIAAAVDIVGVLINMVVLPTLASDLTTTQSLFLAMEKMANALTNVAAFGLYSFAGLLLLPAIFATKDYPNWLRWLGVIEWSIASIATVLLIISPHIATIPLLISFALFAPWVWGSAFWVLRKE